MGRKYHEIRYVKSGKHLASKNRLKKGFRLTTFVASASGVIAGILMIIVSMRYSSALTFYGFSQGDIGKVMVTFSETRALHELLSVIHLLTH